MQGYNDKFDFQIILKSEEVKESSIYWQKQCQMLYNNIRKNLSEVQLIPLSRKGEEGEKADIIILFDVLKVAGITLSSFSILLKLINVWERNRKRVNVKLRAKNGSEFNISNLSVDEALKIYGNIQQENNKQE